LFTYVLGELLLYGMFGSVSREEKSGSNLHEQQRLFGTDMLLHDDMLIVWMVRNDKLPISSQMLIMVHLFDDCTAAHPSSGRWTCLVDPQSRYARTL
jgi:hypothetical protein